MTYPLALIVISVFFADDCNLLSRGYNIEKRLKCFGTLNWYALQIQELSKIKTKHFDINLMKIGGQIRKLWVIKYEIWTAAILFSS